MSESAALNRHSLDSGWVAARAREIGFDLCGLAAAEDLAAPEHLADWLARGFAGEMRWLHNPRRGDLALVVPEARSVIVCALNYDQRVPYSTEAVVSIPAPIHAPSVSGEGGLADGVAVSANEEDRPRGWISRYAWGGDYHEVLGDKLELLMAALRSRFGDSFAARAYVDTGPISERAAAKVAGLGWLGKNTCLINREIGSWLFLGVIITSLPIAGEGAGDGEDATIKEGTDGEILRRGLLRMTGVKEKGEETETKSTETADASAALRIQNDSQRQMRQRESVAEAKELSTNNVDIVGGPITDGLDARPLFGPGEGPLNNSGVLAPHQGNGPGSGPSQDTDYAGELGRDARLEIRAGKLRADKMVPDLCGNCTLCLEACPTGALVEPYVMDARRCISYLTIELRGSIPEEFRRAIGWQVFGCDICQDVCPWNRGGGDTKGDGGVAAFAPRRGLVAPELEWLLGLSELEFREAFRGSPVKRTSGADWCATLALRPATRCVSSALPGARAAARLGALMSVRPTAERACARCLQIWRRRMTPSLLSMLAGRWPSEHGFAAPTVGVKTSDRRGLTSRRAGLSG